MKFIIPILVFIIFVFGMMVWIGRKSITNSVSIDTVTPTPIVYSAPTVSVYKTTPLLEQVNSFDPLETRFAPPVFEKIPELPKD